MDPAGPFHPPVHLKDNISSKQVPCSHSLNSNSWTAQVRNNGHLVIHIDISFQLNLATMDAKVD